MLDPRRLLTFGEVARQGSFSRAAQALSLSQPAVSQQVAALERQVGARLLHRGPGGLTLTEPGELLLEHADALSARLALADAQVAQLQSEAAVALRIGAFPSALATLVPAAIAAAREDAPLQVSVEEGSGEQLAAAVASGLLDLAVVFADAAAPQPEPPGTRRRDLLEEPFDAALPQEHALAGRASLRLGRLRDDAWTAASRGHLIERACLDAGFTPRIEFITRDPLAIRALVAAGLAVTLVPRLLAGTLPGIAVVPLKGTAPRRVVSALVPDAGVAPAARRFLVALEAAAAAPVPAPSS
jgi:DNA-binding transcriptional LysR family regulator